MIHKLDSLIQEIIDFGNVISYTNDPADINYQNACNLFNDYLSWKLDELKEDLKTQATASEIQWAINELSNLCHLIEKPEESTTTQNNWFLNLFNHCTNLQQQNKIAAI